MNSAVILKGDRVLLVSADSCDEIRQCLLETGCNIITVSNGEDAIFEAQHATFKIAVLVSTGKSMDIAETVLNIRDARPAMPIVIMSTDLGCAEAEIIAHACPNARSLTIGGLARYLWTSESPNRITRRRVRS